MKLPIRWPTAAAIGAERLMRILILGDGGEDAAAIENAIRARDVAISGADPIDAVRARLLSIALVNS